MTVKHISIVVKLFQIAINAMKEIVAYYAKMDINLILKVNHVKKLSLFVINMILILNFVKNVMKDIIY